MTQVEYGAICAASVEVGGFGAHLVELSGLIAPCFSRRDLRSNASAYIRALLWPGTAGNCWSLAQAAGHTRPYRLQHLLSGAVWDQDEVRDAVRGFLARHLGDGGVLIFGETGDLKNGCCTAGTGRQYTGTAGRIENAVVAVYATYATPLGHGLVDRDCTCRSSGSRIRNKWRGPDSSPTTRSPPSRNWPRHRPNGHSTPGSRRLGHRRRGLRAQRRPARGVRGPRHRLRLRRRLRRYAHHLRRQKMRADQALHLVEPRGWNRRSAGAGSKSPRYYDWAYIATGSPRHHLLILRAISTGELAYYLAFVPESYLCSLTDLVKRAPRCAATGRGNATSPSSWPPTRC